MKDRSMNKTLIALLISSFLGSTGYSNTVSDTIFKYEQASSFIKPIEVSDIFKRQGLFDLENGSVTLRVSSVSNSGLISLLGVSNQNSTNQYASFYLYRQKASEKRPEPQDVLGVELRNGQNLISNSRLSVKLPINKTDFRTITYTFDKDNQQINIYVDGEKVKTHDDAKFFADIEGLDTAFIGKTKRADPENYSSWNTKMSDIYYLDVVPEVLDDEEVKEKHQQILENHTKALSRGKAFGAFKSDKTSVFVAGQGGAANYRIPALITTKNGVSIAAIDKRNQHRMDWGNIDTAIRRSFDGGKTWEADQVILDLAEQAYGSEHSAFLIDPVMVQDQKSGRLFLMVDMYPETKGFFGVQNFAAEGSGYKYIAGKSYRVLTDSESHQYTVRENGVVYDEQNQLTDWRVVVEGNPDIGFKDLGDLYQGDKRLGNIFLQSNYEGSDAAPLKAGITSYLWLMHSDDDGKTWSNPEDITPQIKADWMRFIGTGPGNGIQLKNGNLILPIYYTNTYDKQSSALIISRDGGKTWERSESPTDRILVREGGSRYLYNDYNEITESQVIELDNGDLKMFSRNRTGYVRISTSKDGGYTWQNEVKFDEVLLDSYSQMSVIKYSKRINGKEYVLFANPHSDTLWKRLNGKVWLGEVQEDGSIQWKYNTTISTDNYAYNSLSELPNGEIGLLYEDDKNGNAKDIGFVRLNLQELLWKDNIIYRDSRDTEHQDFSLQTDMNEVFYKIGDGEMVKVGEGINHGNLIVDEGVATLNQQANGAGEKQAFDSVLVNEKGTVRLGSADQLNLSQVHLNRGTLDLNGQHVQLAEQNNENTGLRSTNLVGNVVNHSMETASLVHSLSGTHAIDGQFGDDKGKLDLTYEPNSRHSRLELLGNSVLNQVDIKNGSIVYYADTQHKANAMDIRTGANLYMLDNAKAVLKQVNVEKEANVIIQNSPTQIARLQAEMKGEGNLIKQGEGHLKLAGHYRHTGVTHFNGGSVNLSGTLGGKSLYLANGTTLSGNGEITAPSVWAENSVISPSEFAEYYTPHQLRFQNVEDQGASVFLGVANTNDEMKTWQHDQLLIQGSLQTENAIPVYLKLKGDKKGASDHNHNGQYDVDEGLSLIQVKGEGKLEQFTLAKMVNRDLNNLFNFTLVSVDKKMSNVRDNQFGEANGDYYDYRLQTELIREDGSLVKPVIPYVEASNIVPDTSSIASLALPTEKAEIPQDTTSKTVPLARARLTSRVPSYLVAQPAVLAQGNRIQQQFIQNVWAENKKGFYVNQTHNHATYRSQLAFNEYGFGYKSQQNSTLFGGYLPIDEQNSLHTGVGFSRQKVTPSSVDGDSQTTYRTTSLLLALHHEWGKNWLLNTSLGFHAHHGKIATQEGKNVAKVKGKQWNVATELGYRMAMADLEITPVVGAEYQHLRLKGQDQLGENWHINYQPYHAFNTKVGGYVGYHLSDFHFKAGLFYERLHEKATDVTIRANQQNTFKQGKLGDAIAVKAELSYAFTPNLIGSLQGSYRNGVSKSKLKQTDIGLQLRYDF